MEMDMYMEIYLDMDVDMETCLSEFSIPRLQYYQPYPSTP